MRVSTYQVYVLIVLISFIGWLYTMATYIPEWAAYFLSPIGLIITGLFLILMLALPLNGNTNNQRGGGRNPYMRDRRENPDSQEEHHSYIPKDQDRNRK